MDRGHDLDAVPRSVAVAILVAAALAVGCGSRAVVTEQNGNFLVTRDRAVVTRVPDVGRAAAEAAALAWVAGRDASVHDLSPDQSTLVFGLIGISTTTDALAYNSGTSENDWVILLRGVSPTWAHVDALLAVDAATGKVRSGQLAQWN